MIILLKKSQYLETFWKNGLGKTDQIDIYPTTSCLTDSNFDFRLSSATIECDSPFSLFPNFQRLLIVWKGSGLKLNATILKPLTPISFSGNDLIECSRFLDERVCDIGLIYNAQKIDAKLTINNGFNLAHDFDVVYLFYAQGADFFLDDQIVKVGDTLKIDSPKTDMTTFDLPENSLVFQIGLNFLV